MAELLCIWQLFTITRNVLEFWWVFPLFTNILRCFDCVDRNLIVHLNLIEWLIIIRR